MRIDWWTLALQTVNVLILIWILARFFFRPVMDIVVKRQQEANKLLERRGARPPRGRRCMRADADKARAEIAAERQRLMAEAQDAAQTEKQNLIAQASQEIAKLHSEAEAAIARDRAAAEEAIIDRASELSVEIAQRLLARLSASGHALRIRRRDLPRGARIVT